MAWPLSRRRQSARRIPVPLRRLAALCEVLYDRAQREERSDRDELPHEDRPVEIDRRTPADIAVLDDPRAGRTRDDTKSSATVAGLIAAAAGAAHHGRGRDHRHTLLLIRIAIDTTHRERVPRFFDRLKSVHRSHL